MPVQANAKQYNEGVYFAEIILSTLQFSAATINKVMLGSTEIKKIYLGSTVIYENL